MEIPFLNSFGMLTIHVTGLVLFQLSVNSASR